MGHHTIGVTAAALFLLTIVGLSIGLEVQAKRERREAQSADAVSQFLVGLFQLSRPDSTQGRSVSARDILDQGTEHLGADWRGQPTVKARLLSTLGNVYQQLGVVDRSVSTDGS